jgi:cytochrome c oxidase assembly protein subunit 15
MSTEHSPSRSLGLWLFLLAAMIFAMVVLGGLTRLTQSGLSIAEWKPVVGAIPPLSEKAWQEEFEVYRRTPEYRKINVGMDLAGFQRIYFMEWLHRLWGRLIFFAALLPLLYFAIRRRIPRGYGWALAAVPVGVALNGALGWFMVASGLVDVPRVSAYRLTAHLGLAVLIYGYVLWLALRLWWPAGHGRPGPGILGGSAVSLTFLTLLAGGFVAGTRAGLAYNTWPLMGEGFFPVGMWAQSPWWINLFENVATVQFNHRLLAYALIGVIGLWWWRTRGLATNPPTARLRWLLVAALALQVGLGIATVLLHVPVALGAAHQAGALLLFTIVLAFACAPGGGAR